jgi:secreted PhoX family phosphatase
MGRISHELVQVMPDERTALMGDDFSNGGLFMFIADKARDLSSGTLYAAQWKQKTAANGGSADLSWINLGHATSAEILELANTLKAADIVDVKKTATDGYTSIPYSGKTNWVKFVAGKEKAAAFLETHRYAAFKGASLGFTKMEGTTVNIKDKIAYSAMASIQSSMKNGSGGISVEGPSAGAVFALNLKGGQTDDTKAAINSEWVPVDMAAIPALVGEDLTAPDALGNTANANKVASPDNIKFSEKLRTLFVGEDSGMHVNNFLWAYNVDTKVLSRLLSAPAGAECTGLEVVDDINGFAYIMSNFQHAGDWNSVHDVVSADLEPLINANYKQGYGAAVGYLTGLPTLD